MYVFLLFVVLFVLFGRIRAAKRTEIVFFFLVFSLFWSKLVSNTRVKVFFERLFSPRERRIDWMLKNAFELR